MATNVVHGVVRYRPREVRLTVQVLPDGSLDSFIYPNSVHSFVTAHGKQEPACWIP